MIQQVLEFIDYSAFTIAALTLFLAAFIVIVFYTLTRSRRQMDRNARLPMDDSPPQNSDQEKRHHE